MFPLLLPASGTFHQKWVQKSSNFHASLDPRPHEQRMQTSVAQVRYLSHRIEMRLADDHGCVCASCMYAQGQPIHTSQGCSPPTAGLSIEPPSPSVSLGQLRWLHALLCQSHGGQHVDCREPQDSRRKCASCCARSQNVLWFEIARWTRRTLLYPLLCLPGLPRRPSAI